MFIMLKANNTIYFDRFTWKTNINKQDCSFKVLQYDFVCILGNTFYNILSSPTILPFGYLLY